MLASVHRSVSSFGFTVWLWAFVFARIPLAAIQHYLGLESRPFVLVNLISIALAFIAFNDSGWQPISFLKSRSALLVITSFFAFWLIYFFRLGFDTFIDPIEFIESGFTLVKGFINSTLIPILCLPWVLMMRRSSFSIDLCALLGNISVFVGILGYLNIPIDEEIYNPRFSFEDLNPIPAGHSSASLLIIGLLLFVIRYTEDRSSRSTLLILNASCAVLLGLWGVRLSMTRSAYVALFPLIVFCLVWLWRRGLRFRWLFFAGFSTFLVLLVPKIFNMLSSGLPFQDASSSGRLTRFVAVWDWICANPLWGVGFHVQNLLKALPEPASHWYSHNIFLESYVIGGLLMFIALIVFILTIVRSIWIPLFKQSSDPGSHVMSLALSFLWIQALIYACFSGHPALSPGFWVGGVMVVLVINPVIVLSQQSNLRRL